MPRHPRQTGFAARTAPTRPRKLASHLTGRLFLSHGRSLCVPLAASLALSVGFGLSCGLFSDRTELHESKRISYCRLKARRACAKLAKQDPALEIDDCVSDRSWQCALEDPDA